MTRTCWLCESKVTKVSVPRCKNGPCQVCIDVANVDKEIKQAMVILRRLLVTRCNLRSEQNRVHDSIVPRLPVELKNKIFELLLPSRDEWGAIASRSEVIMPLYLSSICKAWRDTAQSNPLLWSTIQIRIGKKGSISDPQNRINFVHEWILRSRTMPLTLHIVVREIEGIEKELQSIVDAVSQCSNRWYSLFLDIPSKMFSAFQHNDFQCRLLKRLQIISRKGKELVPFLNLDVNPEMIEVHDVPFRSLQISWNHLSSATVERFSLKETTQLFQHALQMTHCRILFPRPSSRAFSIPPITHRKLKSLSLYCRYIPSLGATLLRSLTLPCLQQFNTDEITLVTPTSIPAPVQGLSRSLTWITLRILGHTDLDNLQPCRGVTNLVVYVPVSRPSFKKLLLEYLPDLCHITIDGFSFDFLWEDGIKPVLLDHNRLHHDDANKGRHVKITIIHSKWKTFIRSSIWEDLKSLKLDIDPRENSFVLLTPW